MATRVTTIWRALLEQAQDGKGAEVAEAVAGDQTPEGCLLNGYLIYESEPERAKELFARAKESDDRDVVHQASIYEARSYEWLGQPDEGRILIRFLLEQNDLKSEYRAQALFVLAVLQVNTPKRALATLNQIDLAGLGSGLQGRIFMLRAKLQSDATNYLDALIEYSGAAAFFEEAGHVEGVAHVLNNRASVERKLGLYAEAHHSVDKAISMVSENYPFLAQFLDLKAQIYLSESRHAEAEQIATRAVELVQDTDRRAVLCENLCTLGTACAGQQKFALSFSAYSRAAEIAEQLDDADLLFKVTSARKQSAERFIKEAEVLLAELALKMSEGSLRAAAKKLDISHQGLMKLLKRNSHNRQPRLPHQS